MVSTLCEHLRAKSICTIRAVGEDGLIVTAILVACHTLYNSNLISEVMYVLSIAEFQHWPAWLVLIVIVVFGTCHARSPLSTLPLCNSQCLPIQ